MKKIIILIFGLAFLVSCNSEELKNQWAGDSLSIDGDTADWERYELQYFEDQDLMLGTLNDSENIYLMVRFSDRQLAHKIQRNGITLWLDAQGEKEKTHGLKYTGSFELRQEFDIFREQRGHEMPMRNKDIQRLSARMVPDAPAPGTIWIIEDEDHREAGENQLHGMAAGSKIVDGVFCYEFRLPIPMAIKSKDKIDLCVELGGLSDDEMKEMRKSRFTPDGGMGMPPGGMSRRPGGMFGGRGGIRGGLPKRQESNMMKQQDIWLKLELAEKSD